MDQFVLDILTYLRIPEQIIQEFKGEFYTFKFGKHLNYHIF